MIAQLSIFTTHFHVRIKFRAVYAGRQAFCLLATFVAHDLLYICVMCILVFTCQEASSVSLS